MIMLTIILLMVVLTIMVSGADKMSRKFYAPVAILFFTILVLLIASENNLVYAKNLQNYEIHVQRDKVVTPIGMKQPSEGYWNDYPSYFIHGKAD